MKIDDEHVLPCDFIVGHMRFRKGVKLETVRAAAERWHKAASLAVGTSTTAREVRPPQPPSGYNTDN